MLSLNQALRGLSWSASARLGRQLEEGLSLTVEAEPDGIRLVSILSEDYPRALRELPQRPAGLWMRGRLQLQDQLAVAVVGTRTPTGAGLARTRRLAGLLAREGVTVISGLARGVDTAAHQACLAAGGRTVAVMGHGLSHCYPPENLGLMAQVTTTLSQFPPEFRPTRWSFPQRNRLIAALARVSVAVECGPASGTISELEWALRLGRIVAVPQSLACSQDWAREWVEQGKAVLLRRETDVLDLVSQVPTV